MNSGNKTGPFLILMALLAITSAAYYPGLSGDYMFDDHPHLLKNHRLNLASLDLESLRSASLSSDAGVLRRPVSMLSFALNRYFFGIAPFSHKVINLTIHLLTGVMLFVFASLLMRAYRKRHEPALPESTLVWLPVVVSGLWLLHPLNLTSVLYIIQRMTSLASFFMVCGLSLYVVGRLRLFEGKSGWPLILGGFLGFGSLAVFSKETGALLPLYLFIVELTLFRFRNRHDRLDKAILSFFLVFLLVPGLMLLVWVYNHPEFILNSYTKREFNLTERLLTEARVLVFYLKMTVMPSINELGLYHDDIVVSKGLLEPPATIGALLFLFSLLAAALALMKKLPLFSLGILWFFCGHIMESTVISLELAHEHRNYLADFGIILAMAGLGTRLATRKLRPLVTTALPVLFMALFSWTTWIRADQWSDNINHAVYEAKHHPQSLRAVYSAGRIHARLALEGVPGAYEKAKDYLERASSISDSGIMSSIVLIKLGYLTRHPVDQTWISTVLERLPKYPVTPTTLESLIELINCMNESCPFPHETMEEMFRLTLNNQSLLSSNRLHAEAKSVYGFFTINIRENFLKGRELFYSAAELDPKNPQRHINLVNLLTAMERFDEAEQRLKVFMSTETHGGNEKDYRELKTKIDTAKESKMFYSTEDIQING